MGIIKKNGKKDMDHALKKIKKNATLYQNLMALYNYRYEMFYKIGHDIYSQYGGIAYSDFMAEINRQAGEDPESTRYSDIISKIYSLLQDENL